MNPGGFVAIKSFGPKKNHFKIHEDERSKQQNFRMLFIFAGYFIGHVIKHIIKYFLLLQKDPRHWLPPTLMSAKKLPDRFAIVFMNLLGMTSIVCEQAIC